MWWQAEALFLSNSAHVPPRSKNQLPNNQEFAEKDWDKSAEDGEDAAQWEEDWDDSEMDDDFTNQLRTELAAPGSTNK